MQASQSYELNSFPAARAEVCRMEMQDVDGTSCSSMMSCSG